MRDWRHRRHRSQLDLAGDVGVSTRHLSFVETGRSRPSPELVLAVADHLDVPLRERNALLLAAGYAPRYSQTSLDDPDMARVRTSIQRMLDAHDPYPGVVIDRQWNVLLTNRGRRRSPERGVECGARTAAQCVPRVPAPRRPRVADAELRRVGRVSPRSAAPLDPDHRRRGVAVTAGRDRRVSERRAPRRIERATPTTRRCSFRSGSFSTPITSCRCSRR